MEQNIILTQKVDIIPKEKVALQEQLVSKKENLLLTKKEVR
jgi:hypothetical protein